uniref:Disintegrin and metalloproteinase domain-containing protein 5-like isoform X6 n=1 Tax=Geotrypetes seraphini TaxID=260995 RepID=A0A6P8RLX5_GEOSA|nr:disintegrin and metalloproteinase domain-containing protein 5-like isoform X6 [Geotrypetes seraphini]
MLIHIILSIYLISIAVFKPKSAEISFEIVTPQKLETNYSEEQMDDNITYTINIEGKEYIIHLEKQIFLSSDFRVHTYDEFENLRFYLPRIETNCFYQGVIADIPDSFVTLRTCSGLRGLLQLENTSYIIKPLESSSTFQHLIYEIKTKFPKEDISELHNFDPYDEQNKMQRSMVFIQPKRVKESVLHLPKFLELYLILSKDMYQVMGEDINGITIKMVQMISYVNTMYIPLNLHIILRGLEIWTIEDKVSMEGSTDDMLIRFINWRETDLIPRQNHDIAYLITSRKDVKSSGAATFGKACSSSGGAIVVNCPCCDPASCTVKRGAVCAIGDCCLMCQLAPKGTLCRKSAQECDLPEYCSGKSKDCPSDFYLHDGYPCSSLEHYCYKGFCRTHTAQCKRLLGEDSKACGEDNFIEVNTKRDRFGNCGFKNRQFVVCLGNDIFCGKLICEYTSFTPLVKLEGDIIYSKLKNIRCISIDKNLKEEEKDPFWVEDGIACDVAKVCKNQKCVDTSQLFTIKNNCDQNIQCNARGVCNNAGNCHCIDGWAPPNCSERGAGGSIDSGQMADLSDISFIKSSDSEQSWKMWLLIASSVLVPALSLVGIIFISRKLNIRMLEPQISQLQQAAPKSDSQLDVVSALSHF